jgi:hypothetical protein
MSTNPSVRVEDISLLGITTDLSGNTVNVFYDPRTQKFYQSPLTNPQLRQEVTNTIEVGNFNQQFATSRNIADRNYRTELRNQNPNSTIDPALQQTIRAAQNNFSPSQPADQQAGVPPPAPDLSSVPITEIKAKPPGDVGLKPTRKAGRFQYPLEMDVKQDKIKFLSCEIETRSESTSSGFQFGFPGPTYKKVGEPVFLSIQAPISDQNSVDWGPDSINAIESALYGKSKGLMDDVENINLSGELNNIVKTFGDYQGQIKKFLAGQAAGINNILARTDSAILNPNLELLFQGPQLRPFTFQFKMSARSEDEAKEIKSIIKYFKYYMSVRKSEDELFLKAPCVFTIQYIKGEDPRHPGINLISPTDNTKACALTNCSVDYTPLGTYMTYDDPGATMVSYTLSLQFQEIEPIYNTDYEAVKDHPIGF